MKFSKSVMSSCISGHLDVSPCNAVIICHTLTHQRHSSPPLSCAACSQIFILPRITANIYHYCQDLNTCEEEKQYPRHNDWVHHKASTEDDHITTCFVSSVPLCWFPGDDPGLVTLQHCHPDSRHVPSAPEAAQTAIVSLMSFCL